MEINSVLIDFSHQHCKLAIQHVGAPKQKLCVFLLAGLRAEVLEGVERPQFDFSVLTVVDTSDRKYRWRHLLGRWNIMILIFFIIFGARSLTRVILAFGEHNHESGNWLQK